MAGSSLPDLRDPAVAARDVIAALDPRPHPEGGHYREIWRDTAPADGRGAGTTIYFLLAADEYSHWHRVDAAECWHWYAGAPLALTVSTDGHDAHAVHLGPALVQQQRPFAVIPKGAWQTAVSLGRWALVGCTVSPTFSFDGFEMAAPDWRPAPRQGRTT